MPDPGDDGLTCLSPVTTKFLSAGSSEILSAIFFPAAGPAKITGRTASVDSMPSGDGTGRVASTRTMARPGTSSSARISKEVAAGVTASVPAGNSSPGERETPTLSSRAPSVATANTGASPGGVRTTTFASGPAGIAVGTEAAA